MSLTPELQDLLRHITQTLDVSIELAGSSHLRLTGPEDKVAIAETVIGRLYARLSQGNTMSQAEIEAAMRMASMDMGRTQNPDFAPLRPLSFPFPQAAIWSCRAVPGRARL